MWPSDSPCSQITGGKRSGCEGEKKGLLLYCPDIASGLKSLCVGSNLPTDSPQMQISLPNRTGFVLLAVNSAITFPHF